MANLLKDKDTIINHVAVYAIAKNEEKNYDGFFDNVASADNIFIGDTGSDSTEEIEKLCNELCVYWQKIDQEDADYFDFALNRNTVLSFAEHTQENKRSLEGTDANYFISLDLDERLEEGWREKLDAILAENPTANALQFTMRINGPNPYTYTTIRGHKSGTHRWIYPVHEVLDYKDFVIQSVVDTGIIIDHFPDAEKPRDYFPACVELVNQYPNEPRAYHYLGRELMYRGDYEPALSMFNRFLELGENSVYIWPPEAAIVLNYAAFCYEHLSRVNDAEMAYFKAITYMPQCRETWLDLSDFYFRQDMFKEAYIYIKKALSLNHTEDYMYTKKSAYNEAYLNHLACFIAYRAGDTESAKLHITQAIAHSDNKPTPSMVQDYVRLFKVVPESLKKG